MKQEEKKHRNKKEILRIEQVSVRDKKKDELIIKSFSLRIYEGEILALVGESGCGKSILCKSVLKLLPSDVEQCTGAIYIEGQDVSAYTESQMRRLRGSCVAMLFQDPMSTLHPAMTVGAQLAEAIRQHEKLSKKQVDKRLEELLEMVGIEDAAIRKHMYPHQFSGGMRQRIVLAISLAARPKLLLADEPTTALDVTIQAQMLQLLQRLQREYGMAILFISHDLRVVAGMAERIAVMRQGEFVACDSTKEILSSHAHPYVQKLLQALPSGVASNKKTGDENNNLLSVQHLTKRFLLERNKYLTAIEDVTFELRRGEILGLVGESGSGKSTVARCIMNIYHADGGEIRYSGKASKASRQFIFQDSSSSLNERMKVWEIVTEPMKLSHYNPPRGNYLAEAEFQLTYAGLGPEYMERYPRTLSGGQRQRVAIARALTVEPELLIADEPLASLDTMTQKKLLELFMHLQNEHGYSMLFIAHDLALVRMLCNRVGVMHQGRLVELAETETLFSNPQHPYTKQLLASMPELRVFEADEEN